MYADLAALATAYHCRYVKLLGGEPLLHRRLADVVAAARRSGVADEVHICTNGRLLGRLGDAVWADVDEIEVSVYPGQVPDDADLTRAAARARAHGTRLRLLHNSHFRESYSELGTDDDDLVTSIYATCKMAHVWRCHTVREHRFWVCPQSAFLPTVLGPRAGTATDSVALMPADGLRDRLSALFASATPLGACRFCLGSVGTLVPHTQVPRREWRTYQNRPTETMIDWTQIRRLELDPSADDGCVNELVTLADDTTDARP